MPMYNLIEYSENYATSIEPASTDAGTIADFSAVDNSALFKFKLKITGKTTANGRKDVEKIVPLNYLSTFWRTLEMHLIDCEINLILTWSEKCVSSNDAKQKHFQ